MAHAGTAPSLPGTAPDGPDLRPLAGRLRATLRLAADPALAPGMQAYMKSTLPYLGVPAPVRRRCVAQAIGDDACKTPSELSTLVRWDLNDELSGHLLPRLLRDSPTRLAPRLRTWARGPDLWPRRAVMLAQRSLKGAEFDAALFYDCLLPSVGDPTLGREFFIRKGMGWALRERSYTAPDEVQAFCAAHAQGLSPLTLREALRVVRKRAA